MNPKFSIVMPLYSQPDPNFDRKRQAPRAIRSIINQQYPNWELIIVNDGSQDNVVELCQPLIDSDDRIKLIHQENLNRAFARNNGMSNAKGDWICWLDSDDEYISHYLRELDWITNEYDEYKIFNFGALIFTQDHRCVVREAFRPQEEGDGHEWFRSGNINTGSFIFRKDLWDSNEKYHIPNECSPYGFAAASKFPMRLEPGREDIEFESDEAFQDGKLRVGLSIGNPWGDDFLQFYLLTRDNKSKAFDLPLYIIYPRSSEDLQEWF